MERALRVLLILAGPRTYTRHEIAEHLDMSERSVYRYFRHIESVGFVIEQRDGRYRLMSNAEARTLNRLLHFSEEEVHILHRALAEIEGRSPVRDALLKKLYTLYDLKALERLKKPFFLDIVRKLGKAINGRKQVVLKDYRSSNSGQIADREVEPFAYTSGYNGLWCHDPADGKNKQFRIARIGAVEIRKTGWRHRAKHQLPFTDAFRMSGEKPVGNVRATLSLLAYNLLIEEHPLAEAYIRQKNGSIYLRVPVADFRGVGRFVLGLPGEVKALGPKAFLKYLEDKRWCY